MRKVTEQTVKAFLNNKLKSVGNTITDGNSLYLHGNKIAWRLSNGDIEINMCGWGSVTTRERLNGLLRMMNSGFGISQRDHNQCLVGKNANVIRTISTNETINVGKPQ
tara:strand:+ start:1005 stop:1328 length:324 start_codon:yes stop_codon:yes gene_type:complete